MRGAVVTPRYTHRKEVERHSGWNPAARPSLTLLDRPIFAILWLTNNAGSAFKQMIRNISPLDRALGALDRGLAAVASATPSVRPSPAAKLNPDNGLAPDERRLSGALMRVNHVGEVCAQALYEGHAATSKDPQIVDFFRRAADEEADHLAWTHERLEELGARASLLNPFWYAGAFALGATAGLFGRATALAFMRETELQVERHLDSHEGRLPEADSRSRAIVAQMKADEAAHAVSAQSLGASELPEPVRALMRAAAKAMTTTAHYV